MPSGNIWTVIEPCVSEYKRFFSIIADSKATLPLIVDVKIDF